MKIAFFSPSGAAGLAIRKRQRCALFLACAGIAVLPLVWRGVSCGHDFDFHLESWMEALRQWHQGVVYPHWVASANYGAGEPRFVFYPPLSWMLGAILGLILPWTWTPLAFTLFALIAMGASFFHMACEWMPADNAALAACLYILDPYVLFVAYERTAYGELLAAAWMPLLVLYALRRPPALLPLSIVVAGLWLTNAPAAVMGSYALAVLVLSAAIAERRWILLARSAGATALGLGLAAFYLVPAMYEQRWVEIGRAISAGMRIQDSFLFGHTGEAFHDQVLHTASWIAVALLAATALAAAFSYRNRRPAPLRIPLIVLGCLITLLLLPISAPIWKYTPKLAFLQFPWRWLLVLSLILAALAGLALRGRAITRRDILLRTAAVLIVTGSASTVAWFYFWQPCDEEDNIRAQLATFRAQGFEGTDEYTAQPADNGEIQQNLPPIRILQSASEDEADSSIAQNPEWQPGSAQTPSHQIKIQRWDVEHMTANVETAAADFAVLRLMDYPAWQVTLNGARVDNRPRRDDGLMTIPLPAGPSGIDIRYSPTPDVWLGRNLSLLALVLWSGLAAFKSRQQVS